MKTIFRQFSRFFIVGGLSALIQFILLIGLVEAFSVKPVWASTGGYIGGAFVNYSLNHCFTFKSSLPHKQAFVRFSLNSLFGMVLNFLMMTFFLGHYAYLTSQILASMVILVWNFLIHRYWTFRSKKVFYN